MKNKTVMMISFLIALSLATSAVEASSTEEKPIIVCTTTILASFVEQIGGEYVDVIPIIPSGVCPAHYDIRPGDVYAVSKASLVIYHGFEPWFEGLIAASGNVNVTRIKIGGPWHPYTAALTYVRRIRDALVEALPEYSNYFNENAYRVSLEINATAEEIMENATTIGVSEVKVVCMLWQKGFVEWLGFNVIAAYKPPEKMSLSEILELTSKAEEEGAVLVIDNLPSGYKFGAKLAADIGAQHVILTNFPGAIPGTETYAKMIEYNARQLFEAVRRYRLMQGRIRELTDTLNTVNMYMKAFMVTTVIFLATTILEALILYKRRE
ncbi:MAG: periplasmic solute binding protein [Candidatus Bathyarchaeota archaeon B63]|nr:MAG: periplasmic solute binding protein [Candidatus Bathyarchaeota archaeon B63]